jgi:hypothetical protein
MSLIWTAQRLLRYSKQSAKLSRPAGVILMGSTTDAVLQWLCRRPDGRWTENHVIERALVVPGRKPGTVRWALVYLRQIGLVEASGDTRNARYLKYRVTPKGVELKR